MKLDKPDALMLHSVLFAYVNSNVNLEFIDVDHLQSLQERLQDFIACEQTESSDTETEEDLDDEETNDCDEDEDEDEDEESPIDFFVQPMNADSLDQMKVKTPDGSTVFLEFEDISEEKTVDALLDEGNVIIEGILKVAVTDNAVSLYDGEEWHDFKIVKLPKSWKKVFPLGKIVGFSKGEV